MKIDVPQEGMKISKSDFLLFGKINNINNTQIIQLNKSICSDSNINILYPVKNSPENLDILKSDSGYYNDICYGVSEDGVDVPLDDRQDKFINNTLCQDDCIFIEFNYAIGKANCSCKVQDDDIIRFEINKTKILGNLKDITKISNIEIIKCYKQVFSKKTLLTAGNMFSIIIIMIYSITIIFYLIKEKKKIYGYVDEISSSLENFNLLEGINKPNINSNNNNLNTQNLINNPVKKK